MGTLVYRTLFPILFPVSWLPSKPCLSFFFLAFWLASILTTEEGEGPSTATLAPGCSTNPGSLEAASVPRSVWQSSLS